MRISDWSSDVCSSDLRSGNRHGASVGIAACSISDTARGATPFASFLIAVRRRATQPQGRSSLAFRGRRSDPWLFPAGPMARSEEHTSELQSLMRISYAVFCLKKKTNNTQIQNNETLRHRSIRDSTTTL